MNHNNKKEFPMIKKLYPDFTLEEQAEAQDTLKRYVALVWRIYQRVRRENKGKFDGNQFKR